MAYTFVKSSYSSMGGECVEVARNIPGVVALRDSKAPNGPVIRVPSATWAMFLSIEDMGKGMKQ